MDLIIVESPTKAKTIGKFVGKGLNNFFFDLCRNGLCAFVIGAQQLLAVGNKARLERSRSRIIGEKVRCHLRQRGKLFAGIFKGPGS